MCKDLDLLDEDFKGLVISVIWSCQKEGFELVPYYTLRDTYEQARLWRQSRSGEEIKNKINFLRNANADFLADCLEIVGPQYGVWATNAIPGMSWHNWGLAVDCYVSTDGEFEQDPLHPGYIYYAYHAKRLQLEAGLFWKHRDAVHIQYPNDSPGDIYTFKEIDYNMKERYEIKELGASNDN